MRKRINRIEILIRENRELKEQLRRVNRYSHQARKGA